MSPPSDSPVDAASTRPHQSLRQRLSRTIGIGFAAVGVLAFIGVILFVSSAEQEIWRVRQGEAANSAARTLDTYMYSVEDYPVLAVPAVEDGVLAARLQANVIWDAIAGLQLGESGMAYVVDGQGNLIAHPDPAVVLARTTISDRPEMQAARESPEGQWYGVYRNFEGRNVLGHAARLSSVDGWVFAEVSLTETESMTHRAAATLGAVLIIIGFVVSGLTQLALREQVFIPLEDLRDSVTRVGEGDLDYRVESRRDDEIGQVALTVNQMTAQLQERERALERARDEAEAASEFKSRILANVSHDLRTPLNGILGYADMLREGVFGALTPEQATANSRILANTQRLLLMVNNLLDQAQIDAGKIDLSFGPFNPAQVVEEVQNLLGLTAARKGLALNTYIEPGFPSSIVGDRQRVQQVLMNMVTNAIKFTDQGTITVRVMRYDDDRWCMQISDTGRGIPPDARAHIFEPFRQVDASPTRDQAGMGLGLSIVNKIVSLMDGTILLDTALHEGSTFTVVLPYHPPHTQTEADPT